MKNEKLKIDGKTFICFHNNEGILVCSPIVGGSASVCVNDSHIATSLSASVELGEPVFSLLSFVPNIDQARTAKEQLEKLKTLGLESYIFEKLQQ